MLRIMKCDICGSVSKIMDKNNAPEYAGSLFQGNTFIATNLMLICGECFTVYCSKCAGDGVCSVCGCSRSLLDRCPSDPPSLTSAKAKWRLVYSAQFGSPPDAEHTFSGVAISRPDIISEEKLFIGKVSAYFFVLMISSLVQVLIGWISGVLPGSAAIGIGLFIFLIVTPNACKSAFSAMSYGRSLAWYAMFLLVALLSPWFVVKDNSEHHWSFYASWVVFVLQVLVLINLTVVIRSKNMTSYLASKSANR